MFYDFMTLLSLGLSVPAIYVCSLVLIRWHSEYVIYVESQNRVPSQLLIGGIYIGFFGSLGDNLWWGFAWTFDYLELEEYRDFFFKYGVYNNVVFRQSALVYAGFLHICAEALSRGDHSMKKTKKQVAYSFVAGGVFVAALIAIKILGVT